VIVLSGVEGGFLYGSLYNRSSLLHAFSTLCGNTKVSTDFSKRVGAAINGFLDLAVGDGLAETYVHFNN